MTEKELLEKLRKLRDRADEIQDDISALCLAIAAVGIQEDSQLLSIVEVDPSMCYRCYHLKHRPGYCPVSLCHCGSMDVGTI